MHLIYSEPSALAYLLDLCRGVRVLAKSDRPTVAPMLMICRFVSNR